MNPEQIIQKQRDFFQSGATLPLSFRKDMLKKLRGAIIRNEKQISQALTEDLGKSDFEGYMCETGMVLSEIDFMIKHMEKFAKRKTVPTPLVNFCSHSFTEATPRGNVLIISPWNYPFLLTIDPLVDALAAGNTAVVKPSQYAPATLRITSEIIKEVFPEEYVCITDGGRDVSIALLKQKFDLVFFTGSTHVGREVLRYSAEHLTPAILELGGKSPCIVDETARIKLAARRIVFGKFLNCGQTCVAPDYILCHESVAEELTKQIIEQIKKQYGSDAFRNPDYGRIINEKHFGRLSNLIDPAKVVYGGKGRSDTRQIEPTLMTNVTWSDAVMQEEVFGPILPILTFKNFEDIYAILSDKPKPLALYLFSENKERQRDVVRKISFGGGCFNDTIIHLASSEMGFGGVGESGMGSYHGKAGFEAFSHIKSLVDKKTWIDLPMRYAPYRSRLFKRLVKMFLK